MPTQLRAWEDELDKLLDRPEVARVMKERCEEQGHDFENCCSAMFQVYMRCKWCGAIK